MKTKLFTIVSLLIGVSIAIFADAKGEEIAKKTYDLKEANDQYSMGTMVLIDKKGEKKLRKVEMYTKKTKVGTNSYIEFLEPADVKGTKFLTIGYDKGDDDQRLYLPALKKVRKISSSQKDGSFMGSDISYYDMEERSFEDSEYKYIKEEIYNNIDCFVIESTPKDKSAPYSKQIMWISKNDYFPYKIECYDKKRDTLIKTIVAVETKTIDGVIIRTKMVVDNQKDGTKTLFQLENVKVNIGIKDDIFSVQNLEK